MVITAISLGLMLASQKANPDPYRYGLSADKVVAMGFERFFAYWRARTPGWDSGAMRGVPYATFVGAKRELNTRHRAKLPKAEQTRIVALDRQIRFLGVLGARTEWILTGGNAVDSDADTIEMADAEKALLGTASPKPKRTATAAIAAYERHILRDARTQITHGIADRTRAVVEIESNLRKIRGAYTKARSLARGARERGILDRFVTETFL